MDVHECDLLEYFLADPDTGVIGLYLESIVDGPRFISLCRRSSKPIVVLKGGKSKKGAEAALSHTASMAGNGAVVSGALAQAGVVEAEDFYQMTDLCRTLGAFFTPAEGDATRSSQAEKIRSAAAGSSAPHTRSGNRIAIMTYSGGAGIVSTDFLEPRGLELADLSDTTLAALQPLYPPWMPPANPMDLWPGIIGNGAVKVYNESIRAACADPGVDGLFAHLFVGGFGLEPDLATMALPAREAGKPLVCWISGERETVHRFQIEARQLNVPVFREVFRAVECLGAALAFQRSRGDEAGSLASHRAGTGTIPKKRVVRSGDTESVMPGILHTLLDRPAGTLDEYRSKQVLAALDIPVTPEALTATVEEAMDTAAALGFPVVMKGVSHDIIHKTEAGLVRLNINSPDQVGTVFAQLVHAMGGTGKVLVQAQMNSGLELIAGLVRDPQFGTCIMCGMGGVLAELLEDRVFAVAPLSHGDALAQIGRLNSQKLLDGFRGENPLDRNVLAKVLVQLSRLGDAFPGISEIDINPLIISGGRPVAVDASIIIT